MKIMRSKLFMFFLLSVSAVCFSQEHYYEADKIYLKKGNGSSTVEKHDVVVMLNESIKQCTVRIDYKEPQIFKIVSEKKDVQTTVKTYELAHEDGRKITLAIKKKRMTVTAHTTGKKYETDIIYSKSEKG